MEIEILIALIIFAFVMSITPGPNNILLMSSGTNFGFKRSIPHITGITFGFFLMTILAGIGASELFDAFPVSYFIFEIVSVSYISYIAISIMVSTFGNSAVKIAKIKPFSFIQALLFQWINPKSWVMAITAASTYVGYDGSIMSLFVVSIVFSIIMLPSISVWALMGAHINKLLSNKRKLIVFNFSISLLLILSLYPIISF